VSRQSIPRKVAVIIGQLAQGGSERQLYSFLKHCNRERWSPIVYVSRGPRGFWDEAIRELEIPIISLEGGPFERMWQFRRSCQVHRVQGFFSWAAHTNIYSLALWGLGVAAVGSFRNDYQFVLPNRHRWLWTWASLAGVSTVICNSQETTAAVRKQTNGRKRVVYVPNSIDSLRDKGLHRRRWRQKLALRDADVLVLGVGRLTPQKNFSRFVETIAEVRHTEPVKAVVAGRDDGCLIDLKKQMDEHGLEPPAIRFIGQVQEAQELMCAADIFLLSSDYEGMPNVVLEAMAAGVPCVCTPVNGVSGLIEEGESGFITTLDASALAERIKLLASNAALRHEMGARAAERVDGAFAPEFIAARLWQELARTLGETE
jgi:glycosyltransferase involved in cell wall biosynthesis